MEYDDYENYYEYAECIEPVSLVAEHFSEKELTDTLMEAGLISERTIKYVGNMEKLVFALGDEHEVYSSTEIQFTERIPEVFVYSDFYKKITKDKNMVCRVIAVRIDCSDSEAPKDCILFEKIIDKALEGFNIFIFLGENSVFFGCRVFDKNSNYDCALSNPISSEMLFRYMLELMSCLSDVSYFRDYYDNIQCVITEGQKYIEDFDSTVARKKSIQFSYIDGVENVGRGLGIDVSGEVNRYWDSYWENRDRSFDFLIEEALDDFAFITSKRINTYEMLFEAEEMAHQAEETEEKNERMIQNMRVNNEELNPEIDNEDVTLLDDPEEMIKILKKRRGI